MTSITIDNIHEWDIETFISKHIIPIMRSYLLNNVNFNQLSQYYDKQEIIDLHNALKRDNDVFAIRRINEGEKFKIEINPNKDIGKSNAKLYRLCSEINNGTLTTPSFPIFTNMFQYILDNFWIMYKYYGWRYR